MMKQHCIPHLIGKILASRGFMTEKSMMEFLYSSISSLSEPFSIPSIREGCEILKKSLLNREKIFIYGDGDTDGICSVYLLLKFFETVSCEVSFRLTHRLDEDYEIEEDLMDDLARDGYSLLIAVDCGISSLTALRKAEKEGIKCIILDHHIGDRSRLPESHTYINPWIGTLWSEETRNLSGAAIVFKFVEGMGLLLPGIAENDFHNSIEIACLSILADSLPLTGENRILVKEGLRRLPFTKISALAYLIETLDLRTPLNQKDVAMKIIPRLNSPGRLGKPEVALNFLMQDDYPRIAELKEEMERMDRKRYHSVVKEMQYLSDRKEDDSGFVISESISPGICGIIASRLSVKCNKPFLVGCKSGNLVRGSIRAPRGYDLYEKLKPVGKFMQSFGGHTGAMGFKCSELNLASIRKFWEGVEWKAESSEDYYDCVLELEDLTPELIGQINEYLGPFGKGNPEPVFFCREVVVRNITRSSQKEKRSFWVKKKNNIYESFLSEKIRTMPVNGEMIDILYTPHKKDARGLYRIYIRIKGFHAS